MPTKGGKILKLHSDSTEKKARTKNRSRLVLAGCPDKLVKRAEP